MPQPHEMDPPAMTEGERLDKRRFEAYFAFETMPDAVHEARMRSMLSQQFHPPEGDAA